jgi:ABC-type lipoprotein release transport system permease subunit
MLEALGTHINLGLPLRIGGIFAVALAVAAAVQIEEWVMCAQIALGLGLFGLGCFGPTDAIVDIFFCCVFGYLIAFLAAMQAENFKAARACRDDLGRRAHSPAGDKLAQIDR